jgi:hypothetical protein
MLRTYNSIPSKARGYNILMTASGATVETWGSSMRGGHVTNDQSTSRRGYEREQAEDEVLRQR